MSRFSVIVSVKIEKKAVKRNRLRRQIYEIIRLNQNMLHCSYDMVFRVKNGIQELGYQELQKHIINIFQSINKFKK